MHSMSGTPGPGNKHPAEHVKQIGKGNYAATNSKGQVISHKGKMSRVTAGKQVQAIYISQHGG